MDGQALRGPKALREPGLPLPASFDLVYTPRAAHTSLLADWLLTLMKRVVHVSTQRWQDFTKVWDVSGIWVAF